MYKIYILLVTYINLGHNTPFIYTSSLIVSVLWGVLKGEKKVPHISLKIEPEKNFDAGYLPFIYTQTQ
jgi:hypothetical protein